MDNIDTPLKIPGKKGRKPINSTPLTTSERSRRYRDRKKEAGSRAKGGRDYGVSSYAGLDSVIPVFIGLDGESLDAEGKPDKYVLLAASDGSEIVNWIEGLSTKDCFEYLLGLSKRQVGASKAKAPPVRFLWFGMDYDINMILKDVPRETLEHLWKYKTARWWDETTNGHYYCISWMPGKRFSLSSHQKVPPRFDPKTKKWTQKDITLASFSSYDVFGFAQEGFVKAALGWRILNEGDNRLEFLKKMKAKRGSFSILTAKEGGQETIRKYNRMEVDLLAEMGKKIWETHKSLGLNLGSMHGAGATARLILDQNQVFEHIKNTMPEVVRIHVLMAYFGGRVQLHRIGRFREVFSYDLHSAYPWAASQLPSLKGSHWYQTNEFNPDLWGIWHVRWDCSPIRQLQEKDRHRIYPFPFRTEKGRIRWAQQGEGWYWTPEVAAALRYFPGMVEVIEGDVLDLPIAHIRPFSFVNDLYRERQRLKNGHEYNIAEKVIKLGLNALYGKTAEGGHKYGSENAKVRLPKNQSYIYAGMITSLARARMLEAAMIGPRNVIGFATDCIFSRVDLHLPSSEGLGGWEAKHGYDGLFIQAGVYFSHNEKGEIKTAHNRGFLPSEFDWERVDREWDHLFEKGTEFSFPSKRFIGLGSALANKHEWPGEWRTWQNGTRELSPFHTGQNPFPGYADTPEEREMHGSSIIVGTMSESGISFPYSPLFEWLPGEDKYMAQTEYLAQPEFFD